MSKELDLFQKFLFEAPGDELPPDEAMSNVDNTPDVPADANLDDGPPDISDEPPENADAGDFGGDDDAPPDLGGEGDDVDTFGEDDFDDTTQEDDVNNQELDEKLSAILNVSLYQKFLNLLTNINERVMIIKDNTDILFSISPDTLDSVGMLKKLEENVRLYLKNYFTNERYEKNLLFFNKCINLYKLIGDNFDTSVSKGIKKNINNH